jgi:hypothetical protein
VHRFASLAALALVASCGARTGLGVPDASRDGSTRFDAGVDAAPIDVGLDVGPVCVPTVLALTPIHAEVLFVLDRSTSMGWELTGPGGAGPTRWSILLDTLDSQLPPYDATSDMGMLLYPSTAPGADSCTTEVEPQLATQRDASSRMLDIVHAAAPGGRTPTADALESARGFFLTHPAHSRARAVVLATDGAPNCNGALDGDRCPCTSGAGLPGGGTCAGSPALCLDDVHTIDEIVLLAGDGVRTYVIGIDGDPDPAVSAVLTRLAEAGGRPNPLDPGRGFYSVQRPEDLAAAFDFIESSIARCALSVPAPVASSADLVVTIDGSPVTRDGARLEGWEWSAEEDDVIVLYGDACNVVADGMHEVELTLTCPP